MPKYNKENLISFESVKKKYMFSQGAKATLEIKILKRAIQRLAVGIYEMLFSNLLDIVWNILCF